MQLILAQTVALKPLRAIGATGLAGTKKMAQFATNNMTRT